MAQSVRGVRNINDVNLAIITGNATHHAEAKKGKESGEVYTDFGLAVHHNRRETAFINVRVFGKLADWAAKHVTKGRRYSVAGRLDGRSGRAGIIANEIEFQDFPRDDEAEETSGQEKLRKRADKLRSREK